MLEAGGAVGADLNGVSGAGEESFDLVIGVEPGEVLGDEVGVVETAGADVLADGGEGDKDDLGAYRWEGVVHDFGEGFGESTDGVIFVVMNQVA